MTGFMRLLVCNQIKYTETLDDTLVKVAKLSYKFKGSIVSLTFLFNAYKYCVWEAFSTKKNDSKGAKLVNNLIVFTNS